jgi:two-component system sensor histidine kinase KdpD
VDRLPGRDDRGRRERLLAWGTLAGSLGAEFAVVPGNDVAATLLEYARARGATTLILGARAARRSRPWRRRLADRIARVRPDLDLVLLHIARTKGVARPPSTPVPVARRAGALVLATLACAVTTAVAALLLRVFDLSNVVMLFLLTVVLIALRWGRGAGALAALLSVASFDFFFVPPVMSFHVSDTQYIFTFVLMLVVALVTGQLAARLRAEAVTATAGERRATTLARIARDLSAATLNAHIAELCVSTIGPLFMARGALVLPDDDGTVAKGEIDFVDASVAQWVYDNAEAAGPGTSTLSASGTCYFPLVAPLRTRGVLVLLPGGDTPWEPDDRRLLDACCALMALALERIHFVDVARDTQVRMEGERLRNALLAAVSHDLKTPLTAISGLAETLQSANGLAEAERDIVARAIHQQILQLHRLVSNLLDQARMQSDGVHLDRQWHSLDEIVGSALAHAQSSIGKHIVHTDIAGTLPLVELDAILFERVLVNLLDNAAKHTPVDAVIWIRAAVMDQHLHVWMDDEGPGLPPDLPPEALFEPFTRGITESSVSGVGLGLALCRSIVLAHGGTIKASQRTPRGARFEIRLPLGSPPDIESEVLT